MKILAIILFLLLVALIIYSRRIRQKAYQYKFERDHLIAHIRGISMKTNEFS